jgi:hypothetical protein
VAPAISELVKQGLRTVGHYRRALAQTTFPGVAVLCYHGVRADEHVPDGLALRIWTRRNEFLGRTAA